MLVCLECERLQKSYADAAAELQMAQQWLAQYRTPDDIEFRTMWDKSLEALRVSNQIREEIIRHAGAHSAEQGMAATP